MKAITKFVSDDGLEFTDEGKCVSYEALCKEVSEVMSKLSPRPILPGCGFENGDGYIQHDPEAALAAKVAILKIANGIFPHKWFDQSMADDRVDPSWAGRLIGDFWQKCLYQAWQRFQCMDKQFREYGQPYFALHPEQAKNVRLNQLERSQ
jgi:hypothetical protein